MAAPRKPMTDAQRLARQQARNQPEARARRAARRAVKHHLTPPPVNYGPAKMPTVKRPG